MSTNKLGNGMTGFTGVKTHSPIEPKEFVEKQVLKAAKAQFNEVKESNNDVIQMTKITLSIPKSIKDHLKLHCMKLNIRMTAFCLDLIKSDLQYKTPLSNDISNTSRKEKRASVPVYLEYWQKIDFHEFCIKSNTTMSKRLTDLIIKATNYSI